MSDCIVVACKWSKCVFLLPAFMFMCMYSVNAGILATFLNKLNKVAVEPRSRAYFEAFTFIKKNKEKRRLAAIYLSVSEALFTQVLLYLALSAVFILFASAQLRFPWMRAETGSSACFSKGSFWEFGSVLDETILSPSEIRWCFSPHLAMTLRFVTHFLVRIKEHSQKQKEI